MTQTQTQTQIQSPTHTEVQEELHKGVAASKGIVKLITTRVLGMIAEEMNSQDVQITIKQRLIIPLINIIYRELHPYIISLIVTIVIILILSLMTFLCFLLYYFKK